MKNHPQNNKTRLFVIAGALIILGGIVMLGLLGCGRAAYAVDYRGQKDAYRDARDTYKAGSKVRLTYYLIGTDTDYSFYLDGERLNPDYKRGKGFILKFTMPDHDVQLECRAVNSMVRGESGDAAGDLLVDFYTASVAAEGGDGHEEMTLYTYTSDQLKLIVYRQDDAEDTERSTTYIVPYAAFTRCREVIDGADMRSWNDSAEPLDGEEGAVTVCQFRDVDGSYVRVTSEAMPPDGAQAFAALRKVLASYVADAYRE